MESESNALLTALGGYDSEQSNSDDELSSGAKAIYPRRPPPSLSESDDGCSQYSASEDVESERAIYDGKIPESKSLDLTLETAAGMGATAIDLAAYEKIRHDLDVLLGCDQVADTNLLLDAAECPESLQAKFTHWYELKQQGANFNETLMRNKTFRNPNIYRWLVDHLKLEEAGSNMASDGLSPTQLRKDFTAQGLAEEQERRAREVAARKSSEAAAGTLRKMTFTSAGSIPERPSSSSGRDDFKVNRYSRSAVAQPHAQTSTSALSACDRPPPIGGTQNSKSIDDAIQRAKLIAQHLARAKNP
ncbi:SAP30-binding protein [Coemansia thaxteri]|uniref:SAP30-binding protein n=1 Tax=Coemansia thaxteri TaxID=2663907 RepID=A0A9W8EIV1_9FUNG|nr:SAP30-binding protein [Coemansia thaxteri]KAJ2004297.1 SAP30-binding protein [Coemansia thaxteri]KAJ2471087.1 SAP30-binding protein [Coemansia sp. RSA 2322]KAJ2481955.1 SAP30-binding protein [Coemansia sp. RSA 2320]